MNNINYQDIQGLVFSGYNGSMKFANYHLLAISDAAGARDWIQKLLDNQQITPGRESSKVQSNFHNYNINIAFTESGLERLGLDDAALASFEPAFRQGMHSAQRSKSIGDVGQNHPDNWQWGNQEKPVDVLLMVFTRDSAGCDDVNQQQTDLYSSSGLTTIDILKAYPDKYLGVGSKSRFGKEHFGFADGLSQPRIEGFPMTKMQQHSTSPSIPTGEFVLGYTNAYDRLTTVPTFNDSDSGKVGLLGSNGTYLVFRQLAQDVSGFWGYMRDQAINIGDDVIYLASKCVGRWPEGSLVKEGEKTNPCIIPDVTEQNNFDFTHDEHGYGCPIGSHIRRTNPRAVGLAKKAKDSLKVANRHRLIRRGRVYGKPAADRYVADDEQRGLLFLCLNANIERQFEFMQHSWVNNPKFGNLYDEKDPIIATNPENMTISERPVRQKLNNLKAFVSTKGGAYFFMPSLTALSLIANNKTLKEL